MELCRTCMTRNNLSPLFINNFDSEQLFIVTGVAISPDDGLSQSICTMCISTIANALDLREISSNVDKKLRKLAIIPKKPTKNAKHDIAHTDINIVDSNCMQIHKVKTELDSKDNNPEDTRIQNDVDEHDSVVKIEFVVENTDYSENECNDEKFDEKTELSDSAALSNDIKDSHNIDIDRTLDECKSIFSMNGAELVSKLKEEKSKPPVITKMNKNFKISKSITKRERIARDINTEKLMSLAVTPYDRKGPVQCKMCFSTLKNVSQFKVHAKTHFEPEYPCDLCPRKFYTPSFLRYHKQRAHGEQKRLKCEHCSFRSVSKECLQNHVYAVHTGERPFVCNLCSATFRRQIVLKQHMRVHSGVKNAQCEMCSSMFKSKSQLWKHRQLVHLTNITYHCYLCTASFKRALPVKRHIEKVHGIPMDQQMDIKRVKTKKDPKL